MFELNDPKDQYKLVNALFAEITALRENPQGYREKLYSHYAARELRDWTAIEEGEEFKYNPALANTARHLANQEGACGFGSVGDLYGNFIPQLLDKYYSLSYKDLNILKVEGEDMGGNTNYNENAVAIIEYILAQRHIDTSILKS